MAKVCYSKGYRTKAAGRRYASGSTGRSGPRGGRSVQDVLSGSKWQGHVQSICPEKPIPVSGSEAFMGAGFIGTSCWQPAMTLELRTPIIKPGVYHQSWYLCTAIQTNCSTMVHCSRCMSQNHQSVSNKEHSEIHVPRSCSRVSHGPGVPQSCVGSAARPAELVLSAQLQMFFSF